MATYTFTFSESVENHAGMQVVGKKANCGFTYEELKGAAEKARTAGYTAELLNLERKLPAHLRVQEEDKESKGKKAIGAQSTRAWVLIVRNGARMLLKSDVHMAAFWTETKALNTIVDKKAFMKGRVVNKRARYNLCMADFEQKAVYAEKKGTIVSFADKRIAKLAKMRGALDGLLGPKAKQLNAELNYYYDPNKCVCRHTVPRQPLLIVL